MRSEFEKRRDYMMGRLEGIEGFDAIKPQGAFYVFCNIKKTGCDSITIANRLLEEVNVAVIPGKPFGSDEHIRLSFAVGKDEIEKGMDRIERWARQRR